VSYFIVCSDDRSHDTPQEQCYLQIPSPYEYNGSAGQVDENTYSPKHSDAAVTQLTHHYFSEELLLQFSSMLSL